jgi:UDP-glucose 4-epimerase
VGKDTALNIAVTGGAGFLGRATIRTAQAHGHHAWSFDHHHGHDVLGDLDQLIYDGGSEHPPITPDVVIHLAGVLGTDELFDDVERAIQVNVTGAARVLDWCTRHSAGYVAITMPPVFPSVYTATKLAADRLATAYHHAYGLPVAHVRAFNAYGPGQAFGPGHPQKIIPTFAVAAWRNEPIPVWGDGEQIVDLIHADDVGRMLIEASVGPKKDQIYDAGTCHGVTVNEVAHRVLDMTGSHAGIKYLPMRRGETMSRTLSAATGTGWAELRNRTKWHPEHRWELVEDTVRWYRRFA